MLVHVIIHVCVQYLGCVHIHEFGFFGSQVGSGGNLTSVLDSGLGSLLSNFTCVLFTTTSFRLVKAINCSLGPQLLVP